MSILNKLIKAIKFGSALATVLAVSPNPVFALGDTIDIKTGIKIGETDASVITGLKPSSFVKTAINLLLGSAGVISFFMLLIGGVQWIMAGGDKEGTEKARKRITAALVGLAIVFSAYALLFIIQSLFGIEVLQINLNPIQP